MKLADYTRTWTDEQFEDAERVDEELEAIFGVGEDDVPEALVVLIIEERKRDPATTVNSVLFLTTLLGAESMLTMRHAAQSGCRVSPDVAAGAKRRKKKGVRGV
jgi:hypothetical protein